MKVDECGKYQIFCWNIESRLKANPFPKKKGITGKDNKSILIRYILVMIGFLVDYNTTLPSKSFSLWGNHEDSLRYHSKIEKSEKERRYLDTTFDHQPGIATKQNYFNFRSLGPQSRPYLRWRGSFNTSDFSHFTLYYSSKA